MSIKHSIDHYFLIIMIPQKLLIVFHYMILFYINKVTGNFNLKHKCETCNWSLFIAFPIIYYNISRSCIESLKKNQVWIQLQRITHSNIFKQWRHPQRNIPEIIDWQWRTHNLSISSWLFYSTKFYPFVLLGRCFLAMPLDKK